MYLFRLHGLFFLSPVSVIALVATSKVVVHPEGMIRQ
jgi:hypothetical protein